MYPEERTVSHTGRREVSPRTRRGRGTRGRETRGRGTHGNIIANANIDANARVAIPAPQAWAPQTPQPRERQYPPAASPNDEELPGYSPPARYSSPPAYPNKNPLKRIKKYINKKLSARRKKKATRAAAMGPAPPAYTEVGSSGGRKKRKTKRVKRKQTRRRTSKK